MELLGDHTLHTEDDMNAFAQNIGLYILGEKSPRVICFSGDLGVGKTTCIQMMGRFLGVTESMTSPTYVISKKYPIQENKKFQSFVHMDTYRITEQEEDLFGLGKVLQDSRALVCIEWPEKISHFLKGLPVLHISLRIEYENQNPVRLAVVTEKKYGETQ
jgi:tRNA threonylcarbamoyladenosine biosynthesis protein TsaE